MKRLGLVVLAALALLLPATAGAYLPTLTVHHARVFLEEVNERAQEQTGIESYLGRCTKVRRTQVNCREKDYFANGEPDNELLDRVYVTSRGRLRNSPVVLRWFF
jgi:hypothetical protein